MENNNQPNDRKKVINSTLMTVFLGNIANALNLIISFLIARFASADNILVLSSIIGLVVLIQIPTLTIQNYITKQIANRADQNQISQKRVYNKFFLIIAVGVLVITTLGSGLIAEFLNIPAQYTFYLGFIYFTLILSALGRGYMYGYQNITMVNVSLLVETIFKLIMVSLSIFVTKEPTLAILGYCIPLLITSIMMIWHYTRHHNHEDEKHVAEIIKIDRQELLFVFANQLFLNLPFVIDIVLVNPANRAEYYPLTVIGKVIFYAATIVANNMISLVAKEKNIQKRRESFKLFTIISLAIAFVAAIGVTVLKDVAVKFLAQDSSEIAAYIPVFVFSIALFVFAYLIGQYLLLQNKKRQLFLLFIVASLQVILYTFHNRSLGDAVVNQVITYAVMLIVLLPLLVRKNYNGFSNWVEPILKKPILVFAVSCVLLLILALGFFNNKVTTIRTKVFINGGGLGGSSAAIELSHQGINFVLIEPSNWLGGQATSQAVSTFDQNGRGFQMNGVYNSLINALKLENKYYAEAAVGPGAPPQIIHEKIASMIDKNWGDIYYNTQVIAVNKDADKILSVLVEQNGQKYQIIADYYLDSSDDLDLTRLAEVPTRLGLDTSEQTGELMALNNEQKANFQNLFGNRIQPITAPVVLIDKGNSGYSLNLNELQISGGEVKSCSDHESLTCLKILSKEKAEFNVKLPYPGSWEVKVSIKDIAYTSDIQVAVNEKPFSYVDTYSSDGFQTLTFSYDFSLAGDKVFKLANLGKTDLEILEIELYDMRIKSKYSLPLLNEVLKNADIVQSESTATKTGNWKTSDASIYKEGTSYFVNNEIGASAETQLTLNSLTQNEQYIVLAVYSPYNNRSENVKYQTTFNNGQTAIVNLNQVENQFGGFIPLTQFKMTDNLNSLSVKLTNEDSNYAVSDAIIVINSKKIPHITMTGAAKTVNLNANQNYEVFTAGTAGSVVNLVTATGNNLFEKQLTSTGFQLIQQISLNEAATLKTDANSPLIFVKLNDSHYFRALLQNFKNVDGAYKSNIISLEPGIFNVLIDTTKITASNLDIKLSKNDKTLFQKRISNSQELQNIGAYISQGETNIEVTVTGNCQDCENLVFKMQEQLPDTTAYNNVVKEIGDPSSGMKLLFSTNRNKDFLRFRQIIDPGQLFKTDLSKIGLTATSLISRKSFGAAETNISYNDYTIPSTQIVPFLEMSHSQNATTIAAQQVSYAYYFWMKYNAPAAAFDCDYIKDDSCTGLRLSLLPTALNTETGFATTPYIRESYRPVGASTLTSKDFYLLEAANCTTQAFNCTDLTFTTPYRIADNFLYTFPEHPVVSFYYPIDIHALVDTKTEATALSAFNTSTNRDETTQPNFWQGLFEKRIKPYSVSVENLYNPEVNNLLFCSHHFSVSQIANGSTREHPTDSGIGQACGVMIKTLYDQKLSNVADLTEEANYSVLFRNLVDSKMYPIPLEDVAIRTLFDTNKTDVAYSYFYSVKKGFLKPRLNQSEMFEFLIYTADAETPADYNLVSQTFNKVILPLTNNAPVTLSNLSKKLKSEDATALVENIKEYRCKKNTALCNLEIKNDEILTRGDFMYHISKLNQQ